MYYAMKASPTGGTPGPAYRKERKGKKERDLGNKKEGEAGLGFARNGLQSGSREKERELLMRKRGKRWAVNRPRVDRGGKKEGRLDLGR